MIPNNGPQRPRASVSAEQCRLWTPYKDLHSVVNDAVIGGNSAAQGDLELLLRKHRTSFMSILETTPKNAEHKKIIEKAGTEGVLIISSAHSGTCSLDEATIAETLILSDLFNINELESLELLLAGESQLAHYPGLTRGLVAVLLYHDGRRCVTTALRALVQARQGRRYSSNISQDMQAFITDYTDQLIIDGILSKILSRIDEFDIDKLMSKMTEQRALGKPKHRHQVTSLMQETRQSLADTVFYWSCQRSFTRLETLSLLQWLKKVKLSDGALDSTSLTILMAFLYSIDTRQLEPAEDMDDGAVDLPLLAENTFITSIHEWIKSETKKLLADQAPSTSRETSVPQCAGLHMVVQFAWSLTLRVTSQHSQVPEAATSCFEEDEDLVESALHGQVFKFIADSVIGSPAFSVDEEFYMRKIHDLITTFIVQMPFKVKELRDIGDDSARIILNHQQDGSEPPKTLRKDFQHFLCLIGEFYSLEKNEYSLAEDFWCVARPPPPRQISLQKFVRLAGELVPPPLFVPYLNMLTGLSSSETGAIYCFNLLKTNGEQVSMVSWDHIFSSLNRYFSSLRQDISGQMAVSETARMASRSPMIRDITEQEMSGLISVCRLISVVSEQSPEVRCALAESQQWLPTVVLFGLVGCSVPINLKAEILLALAALAMSPEVASNLWQTLELSQLLVTTVADGSVAKPVSGLVTELENVESRLETYPMLQGFLLLINNLCMSSGQPPETLGAGYRAPGFHPYLDFIIEDVILKFNSRGYKNSSEKWQVAAGALSIVHKLLASHEVEIENFSDHLIELSTGAVVSEYKAAGHSILTQLLRSSPLLRTLLSIINVGLQQLLQYDLKSAARKPVEESTLLALQLINLTLDKQEAFLDLLRQTGHSTIVSRLEKLLLGINPQSGQADYLIIISRYTSLVNLLPHHALHAVCIMGAVCKQPSIQAELLSLYMADSEVSREILAGLVEGIEQGADGGHTASDDVRCETAGAIIRLLLGTLSQPSPNISHFLLGFNVNKPLSQTDLQVPGLTGIYRTCLHAAVSLIDSEQAPPSLVELAYQLIYFLCSNPTTSSPVLRYLRTAQDFFYKNACKLPFPASEENEEEVSHVVKQQTWFMKSLAIELRVTALNKQRSHTQRLISCLLDSTTSTFRHTLGSTGVELNATTFSQTALNITTLAHLNYQGSTQRRRSRLLQFLDLISFHDISIGELTLEQFNANSVMPVLSSCEEQIPDTGLVAINIPQVHRLLIQEINIAQQGSNTGPAAQREALLMEVKEILQYAVEWNTVREDVHTRMQAFDSWRQVSEIILSGCPEECVGETRRSVIVDLLNATIKKCLQDGGLDDLISPACGVILTLMSNLRQSMFGTSFEETSMNSSLQLVLKGIINLIVTSSCSLQRARSNLYGALLYYLQMSESELRKSVDPIQDGGVAGALIGRESSNEKMAKESLNVIRGFGDALLEVICRDACDGLNVSRMLALSCLDSISTLDSSACHVLTFVSAHGYLRHLFESLVQSDVMLTRSLDPSEPLRHLYIYESTMSLLTRLAMTAQGASTLLNSGLMMRLAECNVYDAKPNVHYGFNSSPESMEMEGFSPSMCSRYRQILLPCLKLCQTVLVSLGTENENAAGQVMKFIVAHADVFYNTLRDQAVETSESLEELSLLTAVLSRAAAYSSVSENEDQREVTFRGQISRIQRCLGSLLSKYLLLDDWTRKLRSHDSLTDIQRHQMIVYVHEIAANITCYCRNVIANSTHDSSYCRVLFGPNLTEALSRSDSYAKSASLLDYSQAATSAPPNLGLIIVQIRQASSKILDALDDHKLLNTRLEGLSGSETSPQNNLSDLNPAESRHGIKLRLERQTHIIHLLSMIIENCLYIVWRHLDFYLIKCVPEDQDTSLFRTHQKSFTPMRRLTDSSFSVGTPSGDKPLSFTSAGVTREQINTLRETTPQALSEPLLQKLADIEQCYASKRTHFGYIGALSRRLRRLINLNCS